MGESSLSSLAIMYIKNDMPIDLEEVYQFIWRPPPEDDAIAKFALRNEIVLL